MKPNQITYVLILMITISNLSCTDHQDRGSMSIEIGHDHFEIDYSLVESGYEMSSDLIDSIIYLQLETESGSQFSTVNQLEVTEDYYIIFDDNTNAILFFNKNGRFQHKISGQSIADSLSFGGMLNFDLDKSAESLSFSDNWSDRIYHFDLDGNLKNIRIKSPDDYHLSTNHYQEVFKFTYLLKYRQNSSGHSYPSLQVEKSGEKILEGFYMNTLDIDATEIMFTPKNFYVSDRNEILFARPYDYTVYKFNSGRAFEKYFTIKIPYENQIPSHFTSGGFYQNRRINYLENHQTVIHSIGEIFDSQNILAFKLMSGSSNLHIYNKDSRKLINAQNIVSDQSTYYLPIMGNSILGADRNFLISVLPANFIVEIISSHFDKADYLDSLPTALKDIYKAGNNSNPVLILTKFKGS